MAKIYTLLLFVMAIWGFNVSALHVLVNNIEPLTLTAARIFVAGIFALLIAGMFKLFRWPTKSEWKTIFVITIFNVAFHHTFLALGLTKTTGTNAGIILGSAPIITMVLAIIFLKDKVSHLRKIGFLFGFIGILFTSMASGGNFGALSIGDLYVLISIIMQAFSFILISKLNPTFDPRLLTGYMLVIGSLIIFVFGLFIERDVTQLSKLLDPQLGLIFLFSTLFATGIGHMVYNYAIKQIGPTETTIFVNLNTLFALLGSVLFLGETIMRNHYIGLVLVIVGVFVGSGTVNYLLEKYQRRKTVRHRGS